MTSLVLLCVAAAALVSFGVSGLCGIVLALGSRSWRQYSAAAQGRLLLGLALLPALVAVAVLAAALAPSFGWIADHCVTVADPHSHPHICEHYDSATPAWPVLLVAGWFVFRVASVSGYLVILGTIAWRVKRTLLRGVARVLPGRTHVLQLEEPHAFVLGVLQPTLFVTKGLLAPEHREHMRPVLAHERAHLARGDAWKHLVARLGLGFHWPGIARVIDRRLSRANEMAADDAAALAVGSRSRVARALVALARHQLRVPNAALGFGRSEIELRVRALLDSRPLRSGPSRKTLVLLTGLGLVAVGCSAGEIHHGVEQLLGVLGGP